MWGRREVFKREMFSRQSVGVRERSLLAFPEGGEKKRAVDREREGGKSL